MVNPKCGWSVIFCLFMLFWGKRLLVCLEAITVMLCLRIFSFQIVIIFFPLKSFPVLQSISIIRGGYWLRWRLNFQRGRNTISKNGLQYLFFPFNSRLPLLFVFRLISFLEVKIHTKCTITTILKYIIQSS